MVILTILPLSAVREEISSMEKTFAFGASLDLDLLGIEIADKTLIPGLAVASSRSKPLAGTHINLKSLFATSIYNHLFWFLISASILSNSYVHIFSMTWKL